MNPVEAIISLTRYKAPLNAIPPEEHDHWRQYLQRGPDQERKENQEILTAFRMLNSEQAETLAHYALDLHNERQNTDNFLSCQILTQIASFVDGGLQSVYADILKRHITFLPALYRGADASARDALISIIQTFERDDYDFGRLVDGLAWIGDDIVQQQIVRWRQHPPDWRSSHYINFDQFEIEAGWELTKEGRRRDLYFSQAYELISDDTAQRPVGIIAQHVARCGWCGRDLETLFDLDLADTRLSFLNLLGSRLRITYCPQCSFFGKHIYTDIPILISTDGLVGVERMHHYKNRVIPPTGSRCRWSDENLPSDSGDGHPLNFRARCFHIHVLNSAGRPHGCNGLIFRVALLVPRE